MPSKNRRQMVALIAKFGIKWVREHGFDRIEGEDPPKRGHARRRRAH